MITYRTYAADGFKFAPGLVLGFLTSDHEIETRYALHADGRMFSHSVKKFGRNRHDFSPKGCKWSPVAEIPALAEFIGNYPAKNVGCGRIG